MYFYYITIAQFFSVFSALIGLGLNPIAGCLFANQRGENISNYRSMGNNKELLTNEAAD